MDGVVSSFSGFAMGREVVQVEFDPKLLSYAQLVKKAKSAGCVAPVFTLGKTQQTIAAKILGKKAIPFSGKVKPDKQPKFYVGRTLLRFLPMTELQAGRINARIESGIIKKLAKLSILSPRQLTLWAQIQAKPEAGWENALGKNFVAAWKHAEELAKSQH